MIDVSKEENYFAEVEDHLVTLKDLIETHKAADLDKYKDEIVDLLNNEIVARYYYQTGRIQNTLNGDPFIEKAEELFSSSSYNNILSGTSN